MDNLFKVLGDQTRIKILKLLNKEDLKMCEIAINFQMSKASISKHLYILKQANLVNSKKTVNLEYTQLTIIAKKESYVK